MNNTSCIHKVHASVLYSLIEESIYSTKFCGNYFKLQKKLPTSSQSDDEYSIPIYSKWIINIQWHRSYSQHVYTLHRHLWVAFGEFPLCLCAVWDWFGCRCPFNCMFGVRLMVFAHALLFLFFVHKHWSWWFDNNECCWLFM